MTVGSAHGENPPDQAGYPAWFWFPPDRPDYAIGFLQPCLDNDSSAAIAKSDAIWSILAQCKSRVITRAGLIGTNPRLLYVGDKPQIIIDSLGYSGICNDYRLLDRFYDKNNYLMVVITGPAKDSLEFQNYLESRRRTYDDWLHTLPHDDSSFYSAGLAPEYYYQSSSWKKATENALTDLARELSVDIKSLYKFDGDNLYKTSIEEGDVILSNWRIIARSYNPANRSFNVLIKMPKY